MWYLSCINFQQTFVFLSSSIWFYLSPFVFWSHMEHNHWKMRLYRSAFNLLHRVYYNIIYIIYYIPSHLLAILPCVYKLPTIPFSFFCMLSSLLLTLPTCFARFLCECTEFIGNLREAQRESFVPTEWFFCLSQYQSPPPTDNFNSWLIFSLSTSTPLTHGIISKLMYIVSGWPDRSEANCAQRINMKEALPVRATQVWDCLLQVDPSGSALASQTLALPGLSGWFKLQPLFLHQPQ